MKEGYGEKICFESLVDDASDERIALTQGKPVGHLRVCPYFLGRARAKGFYAYEGDGNLPWGPILQCLLRSLLLRAGRYFDPPSKVEFPSPL